jgi:hypothetical protein
VEEDLHQVALTVQIPGQTMLLLALPPRTRSNRIQCRRSEPSRAHAPEARPPRPSRAGGPASARCRSAALSCRRRREALLKNLLESGPEHCIGPPFSARRILVCANDRPVHDGPRLVYFVHLGGGATAGFDVVTVGIQHERAVIVLVVLRPRAGRAVIAAAGGDGRAIKRVDGPLCRR